MIEPGRAVIVICPHCGQPHTWRTAILYTNGEKKPILIAICGAVHVFMFASEEE